MIIVNRCYPTQARVATHARLSRRLELVAARAPIPRIATMSMSIARIRVRLWSWSSWRMRRPGVRISGARARAFAAYARIRAVAPPEIVIHALNGSVLEPERLIRKRFEDRVIESG